MKMKTFFFLSQVKMTRAYMLLHSPLALLLSGLEDLERMERALHAQLDAVAPATGALQSDAELEMVQHAHAVKSETSHFFLFTFLTFSFSFSFSFFFFLSAFCSGLWRLL
jgi:hypothetical protein